MVSNSPVNASLPSGRRRFHLDNRSFSRARTDRWTPRSPPTHEAGHALVAISVGARIRSVTVEPNWDDGPRRHADIVVEWSADGRDARKLREKLVLVALAGP